ncbi:anthranilate phosphoribosyltransferase [Peribacillus cavernae]|uniref:Anthranilate phosphoribosyltransferase n=1 Tax=Peribacillus cavernae TaxID=1674310 RepID=A0A3S0U539_9BACI|nr:anthranilate phosphoribosyltransferase [Peribacillus cavernae]MDQ0217229.1 anthranilate phosphoribosyltransferase [Peribacillus cavernae]RUQ30300.1 anthranilate phosphoribosyltransferase [Peribacillus cavernae]
MKLFLEKLSERKTLSQEEMMLAAEALFSEEISDSEIAAFLVALKAKGESAAEIASLVQVLREKAMPINHDFENVMDNCGTGGDGSQSFNISTASAFVIAGAGVKIAKHGNRSVSSKTGSADVLEKLGVDLQAGPLQIEEMLKENGIAFLFAPHIHPKMARIMKIRRELKISTVFNLIGPLTNPVELTTQLLGVYRKEMLEPFSRVLDSLGRKRAIIVNGAGNMDEASLQGTNSLVLLEKGEITSFTLHPEEVGLPVYQNETIKGGDAKENSEILLNVLRGGKGAYRDTVLLNAGLGIYAYGKASTIKEGIALANESIDSGKALGKLETLISNNRSKSGVI